MNFSTYFGTWNPTRETNVEFLRLIYYLYYYLICNPFVEFSLDIFKYLYNVTVRLLLKGSVYMYELSHIFDYL